jgi:hypothetical protein
MNLAMTDSLKVYDILKGAQIPEHQARAITDAIRESDREVTLNIGTVLGQIKDEMASKDFVRAIVADAKAEMLRWMFLFWTGQLAAMVGLLFAGVKMLKGG